MHICKNAFCLCSNLESISLPNSLNYIEETAFMGSKISSIRIPPEVTEIGSHSFSCCNNITDVYFPQKISIIREGMFNCCYSLKKIILAGKILKIEENAFYRCQSLEHIFVPSKLIDYYLQTYPDLKDYFVTFEEPDL